MIQIDEKPKLSELTTLRLGGHALARVRFSELEDLDALPEILRRLGGRPVSIGKGSNILAADGDLPIVLVESLPRNTPGIVGQDAYGHLMLQCCAGMKLGRLLGVCARFGLSGLEGMAGVPGSVGGAVAGNAGALGIDMGKLTRRVDVYSLRHGFRRLDWCDVRCGYRSLSIPDDTDENGDSNWFIITGASLAFSMATPERVIKSMRQSLKRKLNVQPIRERTAGCVFKNPSGVVRSSEPRSRLEREIELERGVVPVQDASPTSVMTAGQLLDAAGFRGKGAGGVRFSPVHANFLINDGSGSATAAFDLIQEAQEAVRKMFQITLEPEVKLWTC